MINELLYNYLPQDQIVNSIIKFTLLTIISILAFYITEKVIFNLLAKMFKKTSTDIDDILIKRKVFSWPLFLYSLLKLIELIFSITFVTHHYPLF